MLMGPGSPSGPSQPQADAGAIPCGETGQVITFFEERCSSCHFEGGQFPLLTRDGLPELASLESRAHPGEPLLLPGDPEGSWLYHKMTGEQNEPGDVPMPVGIGGGRPVEELPLIEAWIRDGAPTECPDLGTSRVPYDPNSLDPEALFACGDSGATRSSPSRLRRVERQEWTHAAMRNLHGTWWGSAVRRNPLVNPQTHAYSTYTDDVGIDATTLGLLMLNLEEAGITWSSLSDPDGNYNPIPPPVRVRAIYGGGAFRCIFDESTTPGPECVDRFVDTMLRRGILFREPREDERTRLRDLVVERLAAEDGDRWQTSSRSSKPPS